MKEGSTASNVLVPLRVLFIEDRPVDVELCLAELKRAGFQVTWDCAATPAELRVLVESKTYDVVLSDFNMPQWTGLDALRLLHEMSRSIPFILVSGSLGEEAAVQCIQSGAADYVLKDRIARLPFAIRRSLEDKSLREERQRAEEQLRLQGAALEAAANGILITDRTGTILWANPAMTKLTGYTPEELVGQNPKILQSGEHPRAFYEKLWNTITSGRVWSGEIVNRRKDGSTYAEEMTITPVRDSGGEITHFIAIKQDVTERKRTEDALRDSEARYREQLAELEHIYSTAPVGLALMDRDLRILRINEHLAAMNGRSTQEHLQRPLREVVPEAAEKVEPLLRKILATGEPVIGIEVTTPDSQTGKPRVALVNYYPLKAGDGTVRGINTVVLDVTERHLMGKQIAALQKFEAIGQLAGGIAHDFNNVIGTMMGWAEIGMEEAEPGSRLRGHFEKICDQSKRAAGLTRQLLAFARRQILEPRNLSLNQVVTDLTNFLRKAIPETVELKLNLAPDLATVRADPTQMEQILMNLCLNARDAMAARADGKLAVETRNIEIDDEYCRFHIYAKPGRYALLSVSDNGTGMDAATQEHIFEPFFTTKEVGQGTGLGLATVYGIVKQHGGFLHVYSEPGHGTTFRVYLPIVLAAPEKHQPAENESVRGGNETILVAEDHEGGRQMVCETLRKLGYTVLTASNGEEAVRVFEQHRNEVDLLLFDVVMPKLSGPQAFHRIEAICPGLPVVFATGYSSEAEILNSLAAEHRHLVQKPYSPRAVARKVRELLDARPTPR